MVEYPEKSFSGIRPNRSSPALLGDGQDDSQQTAPAGPVMQLRDRMDKEFDHYFQRAALEHVVQERRGSLPIPTITYDMAPEPRHRRVSSCRAPRKKSPKPPPGGDEREQERRGSAANSKSSPSPSLTDNRLKAPLPPSADGQTGSAPHSRSSSWRKSRRPRQKREAMRVARARAASVPTEELLHKKLQHLRLLQSQDCYVVRNFQSSSRGIVSKGDLIKARSSTSLASEASSAAGDDYNEIEASQDSLNESSVFRVLMIGDHGVGKSAILQQFMTSEYMGAIDSSFDDWGEKKVSVLLDGQETVMNIMEIQCDQDYIQYGDVDAYVLVYSITQRSSFEHVTNVLRDLAADDSLHCAVILVGNKRDLVRSRVVEESEAKMEALDAGCKCTEVSAVLNHKVDELLVGIARQIRLQPKRVRQRLRRSGSFRCLQRGKQLLQKVLPTNFLSRSCDNLLVI